MTGRARPTILVTDASRGSALAVLRSVARRGWRAVAADPDPHSPGFRSRAVDARVRYPDPLVDPDGVAEALAAAARRHGVDLVVPVTDETMLPLEAARASFPTRLALPSSPALERARDKLATLELARELEVPVPPTVVVHEADAAVEAARDLARPLVVKPSRSRVRAADGTTVRLEVSYAADDRELATRVAAAVQHAPCLVQSWLPGAGVGVELLLDDGRPIAAFAHRRIHEVPVTGGASSLRESVALDPVLYGHAARLLGALRWTGLAMVEFRVGPGGPTLMEVNGRIWGSLPLAVAAGMDFPARLVELLLALPPDPAARHGDLASGAFEPPVDATYRVGVRGRDVEKELAWIASVLLGTRRGAPVPTPPRRAAIGAIAGLADPRVRDDILAWRDPGPFAAQLVHLARRAASRVAA